AAATSGARPRASASRRASSAAAPFIAPSACAAAIAGAVSAWASCLASAAASGARGPAACAAASAHTTAPTSADRVPMNSYGFNSLRVGLREIDLGVALLHLADEVEGGLGDHPTARLEHHLDLGVRVIARGAVATPELHVRHVGAHLAVGQVLLEGVHQAVA